MSPAVVPTVLDPIGKRKSTRLYSMDAIPSIRDAALPNASAMLMNVRAATIWLCLAFLWLIDAVFAFRRHDLRQALVAAFVAACFLGAGLYFAGMRNRRRP